MLSLSPGSNREMDGHLPVPSNSAQTQQKGLRSCFDTNGAERRSLKLLIVEISHVLAHLIHLRLANAEDVGYDIYASATGANFPCQLAVPVQ
jgi:hypothetical protein